MKPGCFIKLIVSLTIVTAAVVWIIQNKGDELIINPGKRALTSLFINDAIEKLNQLKDSAEKDSVKLLFSDLKKNVVSLNNFSDKMFDPLKDSLTLYSEDSLIDKQELDQLTKLFRDIKNERPKKNRD